MNTQTRHFIMWLVALTIVVVAVAVALKMMNDEPLEIPDEQQGDDILNVL